MIKRLSTIMAVSALALSATAQPLMESKSYDNLYVGINGGAATKTTHNKWMKNLNGNVGARVGRFFTPVFGLGLESNAYFSTNPEGSTGTKVQYVNTSAIATINLSNWIGGYNGEPRLCEVIFVPGLGWGHVFGSSSTPDNINEMTSKVALDVAFNVGKKKAWQVYIEPAMLYSLTGNKYNQQWQYNINKSMFQVNVGFIYKFKNTNGTNNFKYCNKKYDQSDIDDLNAKINDLRAQNEKLQTVKQTYEALLKAKDQQKEKPTEKKVEKVVETKSQTILPNILFNIGSSALLEHQYSALDQIVRYMKANPDAKLTITGYASTDGPKQLNEKLSVNRAYAVGKYLTDNGIDSSRITVSGMGATDEFSDNKYLNRVACSVAE